MTAEDMRAAFTSDTEVTEDLTRATGPQARHGGKRPLTENSDKTRKRSRKSKEAADGPVSWGQTHRLHRCIQGLREEESGWGRGGQENTWNVNPQTQNAPEKAGAPPGSTRGPLTIDRRVLGPPAGGNACSWAATRPLESAGKKADNPAEDPQKSSAIKLTAQQQQRPRARTEAKAWTHVRPRAPALQLCGPPVPILAYMPLASRRWSTHPLTGKRLLGVSQLGGPTPRGSAHSAQHVLDLVPAPPVTSGRRTDPLEQGRGQAGEGQQLTWSPPQAHGHPWRPSTQSRRS